MSPSSTQSDLLSGIQLDLAFEARTANYITVAIEAVSLLFYLTEMALLDLLTLLSRLGCGIGFAGYSMRFTLSWVAE